LKARVQEYYQLKGDLTDVLLEPGSTKLVLVFEKRSDPEYSAKRLKALRGFVIASFRRRRKTSETGQEDSRIVQTEQDSASAGAEQTRLA
jgi:hypothetical protein